MSIQLPPNSSGTSLAVVTSGGVDYVGSVIADPGTPTQRLAVDAQGGAMVRGEAANGAAVAGNPVLTGGQDGTNAVTFKTASAANASASTQNGAQEQAPVGNWGITHTPAAATQATSSKAGIASTRHVCTSISFACMVDGTKQTAIQVNLRDGASGAGTILWSMTLLKQIGDAPTVLALSGLSIAGSINTAMTLEFSAAGVAASLQSVSLTGFSLT